MALTQEEMNYIKKALDESARPLFLFDDDPDGTCSFLQLYKYKKDGKGIMVRAKPIVELKYKQVVDEYQPDLIFILDKPLVEEAFLEKVSTPIIWIDHHKPFSGAKKFSNLKYFNPLLNDADDNRPISYWTFQIVKKNLWVATLGTISDWFIPDFIDEFKEKYSDLLPEKFDTVEELLFNPESKIGKLSRILSFNLKGNAGAALKSAIVMTRIEEPYEVLNQTTARGKFIYKKYERLAETYKELLDQAKGVFKAKKTLLVYTYEDMRISLTSDISNELLYLYPEKLTIICRHHEGEYKCSLRSSGKHDIPSMLNKAFNECKGYGGGHKFACGACIKEDDFQKFLKIIEKEAR